MPNKNDQKYKEKVKHGSIMVPFAVYHTDLSNLLPFYPMHWHEEVEIIRVASGIVNMSIGGNWYKLSMGDIVVISPFVLHSINKDTSCNVSIDTIVFNLRLLESSRADAATLKYFAPMLNAESSNPCIITPQDSIHRPVSECINTLLTTDQQQGYELSIKANLFWIFYHIFSTYKASTPTISLEDKKLYTIKIALQYIRANYMNSITIEQLSAHCGYSTFYMMKLFKQFTGITCIDYINNYRLNIAGELLLSTNDDVADIAYQVGYNNVSYFNRQFLAQYQLTPTQFRSQYIMSK